MRSFVIGLERAPRRRAQFFANAARCGWEAEIFPAIDWRDLRICPIESGALVSHLRRPEVNITGMPLPGEALTLKAGHYACALSHMALWRKMLAEGDELICIFEDDAVIRRPWAAEEIPVDADFVFLCDGVHSLRPQGIRPHSTQYRQWQARTPFAPLVPGCGTVAYLITRGGAERGLQLMQPMFLPIDLQIMACGHGTAAAGHPMARKRLPGLPECKIYAATTPYTVHKDGGMSYVKEGASPATVQAVGASASANQPPGSGANRGVAPISSVTGKPHAPLIKAPAAQVGRVVVGLGTGRCGTQSFAMLMARQPEVNCSHHERIHLPWLGSHDPVWLERAEVLLGAESDGPCPDSIRCEVGLWYLPYVPHLIAVAVLREIHLRFVVLERPEDEIVASFLRKVGPHRNHWQPHAGNFDAYDACFPQFSPQIPREEAIRRYCREYRAECRRLSRENPGRFHFFETGWFSCPEKVAAMLEWCGISSPRLDCVPHIRS